MKFEKGKVRILPKPSLHQPPQTPLPLLPAQTKPVNSKENQQPVHLEMNQRNQENQILQLQHPTVLHQHQSEHLHRKLPNQQVIGQ